MLGDSRGHMAGTGTWNAVAAVVHLYVCVCVCVCVCQQKNKNKKLSLIIPQFQPFYAAFQLEIYLSPGCVRGGIGLLQ